MVYRVPVRPRQKRRLTPSLFTPTPTLEAYSTTIQNLGVDHHWILAANPNDSVGSANGTDTGMTYTDTAIAEDAANAAGMDARGDRISLPTTTTINNSAQTQKAVGGWVRTDNTELPFCRIYGEGNNTTYFQFVLLPGNIPVFEVRDGATWRVQVVGTRLEVDRDYQLTGILEGNGFGNRVDFFIDGVRQTIADPSDREPDDASLASRGVGEFGDPAGTVGLDGTTLLMQSPGDNRSTEQIIDFFYNHWWALDGATLTDAEVREELFEKGAVAGYTVDSDSQANMQTDLNTINNTTRPNEALSVNVENVTGGGDLELTATNIVFDPLTSAHVRWEGPGTLTWINSGTSNASIGATTNSGSIVFVSPVTVRVTVQDATDFSAVAGARVLLEADSGGPLTAGTDILSGTTNGSGVIEDTAFQYSADQPVVGVVRQGTSSTYYQQGSITSTITEDGLDIVILVVPDE